MTSDASDDLRTSSYDYELPAELIAQTPAEPRDSARLLVLRRACGALEHRVFRDLPGLLAHGDLLVANESRVLPARLRARKVGTGGAVELLALRPVAERSWEALVRPGRRVAPGTALELADGGRVEVGEATEAGGRVVHFAEDPIAVMERLGELPLPPYIRNRPSDPERYQTVYATTRGSAAAPTAGLHFTPGLLEELARGGIEMARLTLHVGLGTFRPVGVENVREHRIHREWCRLDAGVAARVETTRRAGGRVVAVGSTSVRVLETAARAAPREGGKGPVAPIAGETELFIYPGFAFRAVDAMITNFHLPRSSLLMLVSAFAGRERILAAYREAVALRYRFFSFGDAMLIV